MIEAARLRAPLRAAVDMVVVFRCYGDEDGPVIAVGFTDGFSRCESIYARHTKVQEHNVRIVTVDAGQDVLAVVARRAIVPFHGEQLHHDVDHIWVVVNDKHARHVADFTTRCPMRSRRKILTKGVASV